MKCPNCQHELIARIVTADIRLDKVTPVAIDVSRFPCDYPNCDCDDQFGPCQHMKDAGYTSFPTPGALDHHSPFYDPDLAKSITDTARKLLGVSPETFEKMIASRMPPSMQRFAPIVSDVVEVKAPHFPCVGDDTPIEISGQDDQLRRVGFIRMSADFYLEWMEKEEVRTLLANCKIIDNRFIDPPGIHQFLIENPAFEPVPPGSIPPHYEAIFTRHPNGALTVEFNRTHHG